jgi:hypothetical protein
MSQYSITDLTRDLNAAMASRPVGPLSGRGLGNPANLELWGDEEIESLYEGLETARASLYPEFTMQEFARVATCVGMQESTGDLALYVAEGGVSQGLMQVSPATVVVDYEEFGLPIPPVVSPRVELRLDDPGTSVVMWAWYTRVSALSGVSVAEYVNRVAWDIDISNAERTLASGMLAWLEGPGADADDPAVRDHFRDYTSRIGDYWTESGFGSVSELNALMQRPLFGEIGYVLGSEPPPPPPPVAKPTRRQARSRKLRNRAVRPRVRALL